MLPYLPMIASLVSSGYGAIKEGQQRAEMAQERQKWNADNESLYNQDYYGDYTQRADAQNVIRQMRDQIKSQDKIDQNVAAVTGESPEAINAGKERRNKAMTDVYANLGAMGANYKERAKDRYIGRKQAMQGMEYDTMNQNAGSSNNLLYNGLSSLGETDWASVVGGGKSAVGSNADGSHHDGFDTKTGIPWRSTSIKPEKDMTQVSSYVNTKPW